MAAPTTAGEITRSMPGIAYLFSRYPVPSQTFCDREMLAHEAAGFPLLVASLNPPATLFRHDHFSELAAEIVYPPAQGVPRDLAIPGEVAAFAADFETRFGDRFNPRQRARNAAWFADLLKARGIRHCHVHFANQATITALFMKQTGISYSFTAHGQDFTVDLGSDGVLQELVADAEFVVAVSDSACRQLRDMCPGNDARIHRVYNGIDLHRFPAADPAAAGPMEIISIGRLVAFKGFLTLVEACGMLRDRGVDFRLTIIGEGPLRDELEEKIRTLDLDGHVTLAGLQPIQKIRALLTRSQVFALGSIIDDQGAADTLPTVIAEAMACSLPVVSTRVAGIPEMVENGETGFLVEPGDPAALADALAKLAGDPAARQAMGRAGRTKVETTFELGSCAAQLRRHLVAFAQAGPVPDILCLASGAAPPELELLVPEVSVLHLDKGLPEASVLEAEWLARDELRGRAEKIAFALPRKFRDSWFFHAARQAVTLAPMVKARNIRLIHALRSDTAPVVHLLAALTGIPATATIEADPIPPRPLLRAILPGFAFLNLADPKLAGEPPFAGEENSRDLLELTPPQRKKVGIGVFSYTRPEHHDAPGHAPAQALLAKLKQIADA